MKSGLHIIKCDQPQLDTLLDVMPSFLKWMDFDTSGVGYLDAYRTAFHRRYGFYPFVIGRLKCFKDGEQNIDQAIEELTKAHRDWGHLVNYWEIWNEPAVTSDAAAIYLQGNTIAIQRAIGATVPLAIFSLGEGNPSGNSEEYARRVNLLAPCIRLAKQQGGIVALHEYSQPRMSNEYPWHTGRFQKFLEALPSDLKDIKIAITECGIDYGAIISNGPSFPKQGWVDKNTEDDYLVDIKWYDGILSNCPNIICATYFDLEGQDGWEKFRLSGAHNILSWIRSQTKVNVLTPKPTTPTVNKESMIYIAIIPSNQNTNPVYGGSNEKAQMDKFADTLGTVAARFKNLTVKVFKGNAESLDKTYLEGLYGQQRAAKAWLDTFPNEGNIKITLNVHSDSGTTRHIGYYYWAIGHSQMLGKAIIDAIRPIWDNVAVTKGDYSDYIFVTAQKGSPCTPILLELGAHLVKADVDTLTNKADQLAETIFKTIFSYFGKPCEVTESKTWPNAQEIEPNVSWSDVGYYATWASLRVANKEDPRIAADFESHCRAIGKMKDIRSYGFPR